MCSFPVALPGWDAGWHNFLKIPIFEQGSKTGVQDNITKKLLKPKWRVDSATLYCTSVNALHIHLRKNMSVGELSMYPNSQLE